MNEQRVGSYRLIRQLMSGQNCMVWEAFNDAKQQRYAIKTLHSDRVGDKEQVAFMRHEYAVGADLKHKNVIRMEELGVAHGAPFLVMEFYPYLNMKHHLQQGGRERFAGQWPDIIVKAAEGLAYFHSKGWVHKDIKPENYLLSNGGDVKLIDFALAVKSKGGLAKMFSGRSKIQGTRSYMSPEHIRGQPLDRRADIYSFGCMLYDLFCGRAPYTGSNTTELFTKHLQSAPPSLEVINKNVSPECNRLVQRMLSKRREDRPQSMDDFLTEFRAIRVYKEPPRPAPVAST